MPVVFKKILILWVGPSILFRCTVAFDSILLQDWLKYELVKVYDELIGAFAHFMGDQDED